MVLPRPWLALVIVPLVSPAGKPAEARVERIADVRIEDAAIAIADPRRPVILYNPARLAELGPSLAAFVLAHEEAHIRLGHERTPATDDAQLRAFELEADCAAARALRAPEPGAVRAALAHFTGQGEMRSDDQHPSGRERAQMIRDCAS